MVILFPIGCFFMAFIFAFSFLSDSIDDVQIFFRRIFGLAIWSNMRRIFRRIWSREEEEQVGYELGHRES